jgi:hypothetical protein
MMQAYGKADPASVMGVFLRLMLRRTEFMEFWVDLEGATAMLPARGAARPMLATGIRIRTVISCPCPHMTSRRTRCKRFNVNVTTGGHAMCL